MCRCICIGVCKCMCMCMYMYPGPCLSVYLYLHGYAQLRVNLDPRTPRSHYQTQLYPTANANYHSPATLYCDFFRAPIRDRSYHTPCGLALPL